jgi:dihydroneopterin aldolase
MDPSTDDRLTRGAEPASQPDTLLLRQIAVDALIGAYEWERTKPQTVWVDLELGIDARRAAATDALADAIDYAGLVAAVKHLAQQRHHTLLETLAEAIASLLLRDFQIPWVTVCVAKRALPGIESAAVKIRRAAPFSS